MPKRISFAVALVVAVLAACSNSNPYLGTTTPSTPTPNPSYSPNPGITTTSVLFSVASTPIPNQPIAITTPDAQGRAGTTPIATVVTNSAGTSAFSGLTATQTYCFSTKYTPPGTGMQSYTICAFPQYWQISTVRLGNP